MSKFKITCRIPGGLIKKWIFIGLLERVIVKLIGYQKRLSSKRLHLKNDKANENI